jgi:hypothetical protein
MKRKYDEYPDRDKQKRALWREASNMESKRRDVSRVIENVFYNPDVNALTQLAQALPNPLSMALCDTLLRKVSIYLKRNTHPNQYIKQALMPIVTLAITSLNQNLEQDLQYHR